MLDYRVARISRREVTAQAAVAAARRRGAELAAAASSNSAGSGSGDGAPSSPVFDDSDRSVITFTGHAVAQTLIRCSFSPGPSTGYRYVVSGSADGRVYIWDVHTGQCVKKLEGHRSIVRDVAWQDDLIVSSSVSFDSVYSCAGPAGASSGRTCSTLVSARALCVVFVPVGSNCASLVRDAEGAAARQCCRRSSSSERARRAKLGAHGSLQTRMGGRWRRRRGGGRMRRLLASCFVISAPLPLLLCWLPVIRFSLRLIICCSGAAIVASIRVSIVCPPAFFCCRLSSPHLSLFVQALPSHMFSIFDFSV
jgi:hypothetical protein